MHWLHYLQADFECVMAQVGDGVGTGVGAAGVGGVAAGVGAGVGDGVGTGVGAGAAGEGDGVVGLANTFPFSVADPLTLPPSHSQ